MLGVLSRVIYHHIIFIIELLVGGGSTQPINLRGSSEGRYGRTSLSLGEHWEGLGKVRDCWVFGILSLGTVSFCNSWTILRIYIYILALNTLIYPLLEAVAGWGQKNLN